MSRWPNKLLAALRTLVRPEPVYLGAGQQGEVLAQFSNWCAQHAGAACEIGLSSHWIAYCLLPAQALALSREEQKDYARRQFDHYFGAAPRAVSISENPRVPLACGCDQALIDALQAAAKTSSVRIARIVPWWARSAEQALKVKSDASIVLAAQEGERVTLIAARDGVVQRVLSETSSDRADWVARIAAAGDGWEQGAAWQFLAVPEGIGASRSGPDIAHLLRGRGSWRVFGRQIGQGA